MTKARVLEIVAFVEGAASNPEVVEAVAEEVVE